MLNLNSYYSQSELASFGFAKLGQNCKISRHAVFNSPHLVSMGDYVRIEAFALINEKVELGHAVYIEPYAFLSGFVGIKIGNYTIIASRVSIFTSSSDYSGATWPNPLLPAKVLDKNLIKADLGEVEIGSHCTIGPNSLILPRVKIATGCSLGSFSFAKTSTKAWGIYAGIPIKRLKERSQNLLKIEQELKNRHGNIF